MNYEIIEASAAPDSRGYLSVRYRTGDGQVHKLDYTGYPSPAAAIQERLKLNSLRKGRYSRPPGSFGMVAKMDSSGASLEELKQWYREDASKRGYDVDSRMVPRKRQPAHARQPDCPKAAAALAEQHEGA